MAIRTLVAKLVADTGQFKRGMKQAESVLTGFAGKVAALAGGFLSARFLTGAISQSIDFGDALAKASDRLGLTTQQLGALRHAGELAGVGFEGVDNALEQFVRRMGEAQTGQGEALATLKALGLSARELASKSPYQSLIDVSDALQMLPNQAAKAAAAYDLFGRQGVKLLNLLGQNGAGLREASQEIAAFGTALDRTGAAKFEILNDNLFRLKETFRGIKLAIGTEFTALLDFGIVKFIEWANEGGRAVNFVKLSIQTLTEVGIQAAASLSSAWTIAVEGIKVAIASIQTVPKKAFAGVLSVIDSFNRFAGRGFSAIGLGGLGNVLQRSDLGGKASQQFAPAIAKLENQVAISLAKIKNEFDDFLNRDTATEFRSRLDDMMTQFTRSAQEMANLATSTIDLAEANEKLKDKSSFKAADPQSFREIALSRTAIGGLNVGRNDPVKDEIKKSNKVLTEIHRELKRVVFRGNEAVFA